MLALKERTELIANLKGVAWFVKPATPIQQVFSYLIVELFLLSLFVLYLLIFKPIFFPLDDAYITLHNALVLHSGHDSNYIGVSPLTGTTSIVHLLLVYLLIFWLQPLSALLVSQWLAIIVYALGLLRLAYAFQASLLQAICILIIGFLYSTQIFQLLNGLETGLALAAVTWSLVLLNMPSSRKQCISLGLLCGVMPFIRPELLLWSLLIVANNFWQTIRHNGFQKSFIQSQIILNSLIVVAVVPWMLIYWIELKTFYPLTLHAKTAFYAEQNWPLVSKYLVALIYLKHYFIWTGILSCVGMLFLLGFAPYGLICWLFIIGFILSYGYYFPQSILFHSGRYLALWLPFLFYGLLAGLTAKDSYIKYFAYFILAITFLSVFHYFPQNWEIYRNSRAIMLQEQTSLATWCQENLPENAVILIHDAGYLSFATPFRLVDMVGLKTPDSTLSHEKYTAPTRGEGRIKAISEILKNNQIQYMIVVAQWDQSFGIISGLKSMGWGFKQMRFSPWGYQVYRVMIIPEK